MKSPAIQLRGLQRHFAKFSLGPLDLTVPTGAIYGFVGPNGSGKSTTLDMLFGMGAADAGSMQVLGLDPIAEEVKMKLQATYVSPETSFAAWGKVSRLLAFVSSHYPTWDHALCQRLLGEFKLTADAKIATLSFGNRTKLALVLALCPRPKLLVMDEPTTGLDPEARHILFTELLRHVEDDDHSVLISSHELGNLERYADHLGVLRDGRLILEGSIDSIQERFRMAEFACPPPADAATPGLHVRKVGTDRFQAVVDNAVFQPTAVLQPQNPSPLTLEEIYLAITT